MKRYFSLLVVLALTATAWAQHTDLTSYYSAADGKCGATLKTALFNIITSHTNIGYDGLWTAYQTTDKRSDGKLYDIYSNTTNYVIGGSAQGANYSKEGESYNREHIIPQSVFNEKSPMKADAHFVYPADGYINNMRSNYPFGTVGTVTTTSNNGYSKLGSAASSLGYSGTVFEPNNEYKGDIARAILYFVTCYESELTSSEWKTFDMFDKTSYPSLTTWATTLLLAWSAADPVSQKEIDRNDAVDALQGNRNPFVDYPGIERYIWGDMKTTNVNLADLASGSASVIRPVISPNGGTFSSSQSVTITCATSGATIYYTLDGSTPTNSSTAYTGPIALTSTTTLKAIAYVGSNASSVATATFTKSSSGGSVGTLLYESFSGYTSSNDGTAAIATDNANLDYSSWTSFDRLYLGKNGCGKMGSGNYAGSMTASNLPLTGDGTLTFKVQKYGTDTGTLGVTVTGATATGDLTVTPESDWTDYTVNLTAGTGNVSITFATSAKRAYIDEIRLVAAGSEVTAPDAPVFSPNGGSFTTSQDVTITCATEGTTIYYTTDGTPPTQSSTQYSGIITLQATTTLTAVAIDGDGNASDVSTATFTKTGSGTTETQLLYESFSGYTGTDDNNTALATNSQYLDYSGWTTLTRIYPGGTTEGYNKGAYGKMGKSDNNGSMTAEGIALTGTGTLTFMAKKWSNDTGKITVSVTGADASGDVEVSPTDTWTKYTVNLTNGTGDVSITFATSSKRARIDEIELISGAVEEATPADPTFGVAAGTYTPTQTITLACATTGANIYYTTDGSEPSSSNGTLYTAAFTLPSVGTYTVKAIAVSSGGTKYSSVVSRTYTIEEATPADPTFSPAAGTYTAAQSITISCATSGAVIHYTTDGTTPTASSPTYSSAISLSTNGTYTIKAIAVSAGGTKTSGVATATYTINIPTPPAAPSFSLAGGTYNTPQSIQVVAEEGCTITYYWGTNSSNGPSVNYTIGTGAVVLNSAGTYYLKAYATKDDVDSDVTEATYIYTPTTSGYSSTKFVKATKASDLVADRPCLIVCEAQGLAIQTIASKKGTGTSVTISSNEIDISSLATKPAVYTLGTSTVSGTDYWTFKNGGNYIKAVTSSDKSSADIQTESSLSDLSRWTITFDNGNAKVTAQNSLFSTRQLLFQASTVNAFKNYASSNVGATNYNTVQIYVGELVSSTPDASTLSAGLYRIKDAVGYLCVDTNGTLTKTSDASDLGTIFKVTGSNGTYQLEAQGKSIASNSNTTVTLGDNAEVSLTHGTNNEYISVGNNMYINADGKAAAVGAEWTFEEITTSNNTTDAPSIALNAASDEYFSTFYADFPFTVSGEDVTVYTVNSSKSFVAIPSDTTIPARTAVVIASSDEPVSIVPKPDALDAALPTANQDNILRGTCQPITVSSLGLTTGQKVLVFNGKDKTPGFYPYSGNTLGANKVYIVYPFNE